MNRLLAPAFFLFFILVAIWGYGMMMQGPSTIISPRGKSVTEKPLERYQYDRMRTATYEASTVTAGEVTEDRTASESRSFSFVYEGKKVSGVMTLPKKQGAYPVIVLIRGYVDPAIYVPGTGSKHIGELLADRGFVTLAPDFLGYGSSDAPSTLALEERFQTYGTVLTLLSSLDSVNAALTKTGAGVSLIPGKTGIWGHSNGGQIAISVLEMSGKPYPTVLWAPVSKPFPYSILYYTDEFEDRGKALRKLVADFERSYDSDLFSPNAFYPWITAPIQVHQGTGDEAVPVKWSDDLTDALKKQKTDVSYFTYPGEDHNFARGSWETVAVRTVSFFQKHLAE